ncbi:uncharacterized protein LOC129578174 [Sitodiplosis mosellana]|uniref:uncharacterized protein LOC129578174 n=1 Tax=Sitodiplosis mosellana TaxID=263140 RepID=UPI0024438731|nr:uncharacterized protein LOC129578174 [Sitodiplosis mosellana]
MNKGNLAAKKSAVNSVKSNTNHRSDLWGNQEIHIVDTVEKCKEVVKQLRLHTNKYNVIGIGCNTRNFNQKFALILLASYLGSCALIRLHSLDKIPRELWKFLEDKNIVKVGVNVAEIAINLSKCGLYVASILDLRYLAQQCNYPPESLALLSASHLKVVLIENHRLERKHWTKPTNKLDIQNVEYAAKSVRVAIELFKKFENEIKSKNLYHVHDLRHRVQMFINKNCKPHFNHIYQKKKENENQTTETVNVNVAQNDKPRNREIHVISNVEECRAVMKKLRAHCKKYNVLGLTCKYESTKGSVNLLQLASHCGLCALFRLRTFDKFPVELQEILEDKNILKVGHRVSFHVDKLEGDYGFCVASAIDLRYLAKECEYPADDLELLSNTCLNFDLKTLDWRVLSSDWKYISLREEIDYAAKIVHATIDLFKFFEKKLVAEKYLGNRTKFFDELCLAHLKEEIQYSTLPPQEIRIVSNAAECQSVVERLRIHCDRYNVLGFDCEWNTPGGRKVALLQLATYRGLCALIRLCKMKTIPVELQAILEDENILKVGIMPHKDGNRLGNNYRVEVSGILDLKHLAKKCKCKAEGIRSLSEEVLNVKLDYKKRGRISREIHKSWENDKLNDENIQYAANDGHVAIELFKKFQQKLMSTNHSDDQTKDVKQFIDKHCASHLKKKAKPKQKKTAKTKQKIASFGHLNVQKGIQTHPKIFAICT